MSDKELNAVVIASVWGGGECRKRAAVAGGFQ